MGIFKSLFGIKEQEKAVKQTKKTKSFKGAKSGRFTNWLFSGFTKINVDTRNELRTLITRCRDLSKNNEVFRSHLNNFEKSIIGNKGFKLQSLVKLKDGRLDEEINDELEQAWWNFGKRSNGYITKDGLMGDLDLDALILRTLIIDGEVFIRIDDKAKNPYGLTFELLDSCCIDFDINREGTPYQNPIVAGIEIDSDGKPLTYYYRRGNNENYQVGAVEEIPANQIIHIYKHEFIGQVRGFPELCASIDSLKQLDDYAVAELFAAKVAACQGIFYERNGETAGDWMEKAEAEDDDQGTFISELSPGEASIVPKRIFCKKCCSQPSQY